MKQPTRTTSPTMRRIVAALETHGPMTARQIAEKAHCQFETFAFYYRVPLLAEGKIHIVSYERSLQGSAVPTFAAGPEKKKAALPPKLTQRERTARWKAQPGWMDGRKRQVEAKKLSNPMLTILGLKPRRKATMDKEFSMTQHGTI